jgi:hypothetical protein
MSAPSPMNDFAEQKRMLVLRAELHRQIIQIERFRLEQRVDIARERFHANRWWIIGGVAATGWLSTRKFTSLFRLVPAGMAAWRMVQKLRA